MVNMRVRVGILTNQTRETSFQQYARSRFLWNTLRASSLTVCLSIPLSGIWPYFRSTRPNRFSLPMSARVANRMLLHTLIAISRHFRDSKLLIISGEMDRANIFRLNENFFFGPSLAESYPTWELD